MTVEDNTWFGVVRWCNEDIAAKLEDMGIEPNEENINAVRSECEDNHFFKDYMIEAGWSAMESIIDNIFRYSEEAFI